jgi:sugar phosphate isomerase/epimerase
MKIVCCWMFAIGKYGFPPSLPDMLKAIPEMAALGFEYVELEGVGFENLRAVIDHREQFRDALQAAGVKLSNFAIILPEVVSEDPAIAEPALAAFTEGVRTAAYLGSPNVWVDSYFPPVEVVSGTLMTEAIVFGQQPRIRIPDGFNWPCFWEHYVRVMKRCTQIAREHGVQLLVEPRVGELTSNSEALLRLLDAVGDDNLGVILDTAHQHAQKEMLPLSVEKLGRHIRYVHVADNDGTVNRHFEPGEGTIDWEEVILALKRQGFDGYYAVDLEQLPDLEACFVRGKQFLETYAERLGL